jgi:peptidoglycan/xylan/chitin deacetylase (PgdA/CDA1 family)
MRGLLKQFVRHLLLALRGILDPLFHFEEVSVLCYHSISHTDVSTAVSPEEFEKQLEMLRHHGYAFVSLTDVVAWMRGESASRRMPRKAVALTFDDGYADFETAVIPLLEKFNVPATIFLVGDEKGSHAALGNDIPLLSPEAFARVRTHALVEIGFHSMTHANPAGLSSEELAEEIRAPFDVAQGKPRFFAYPGGKHTEQLRSMLRSNGYEAAFGIRPVLVHKNTDPYLVPRSVILKDMTLSRVRMQATKAADWYYRLAHLF